MRDNYLERMTNDEQEILSLRSSRPSEYMVKQGMSKGGFAFEAGSTLNLFNCSIDSEPKKRRSAKKKKRKPDYRVQREMSDEETEVDSLIFRPSEMDDQVDGQPEGWRFSNISEI